MHKLVSRSKSLREIRGAHRAGATKAPVPLPGRLDEGLETLPAIPTNDHVALNRPALEKLPSLPERVERPSSSSGAGPRKTTRDCFRHERRESRDDFYLDSSTYSGTTCFGGPSASSGDPSTKAEPVQLFASSTISREPTIESRKDAQTDETGVASGGPSHPPGPREHGATRDNSADTFGMSLSRRPTGRWKFRDIFGRRQAGQADPAVSSPDLNGFEGIYAEKTVVVTCEAMSSGTANYPARSNTISSGKNPRHMPAAVRSQTLPPSSAGGQKKPIGREDRTPTSNPSITDAVSDSKSATGLILDVEIPDVQLERYSVMFKDVLDSNSSSTMCQDIVQEPLGLEDPDEKVENGKAKEVAREETSPQLAAVPSESAWIPTSDQVERLVSRKAAPRFRSNTSPARVLPSSEALPDHPMPSYMSPNGGETSHSTHPRHPAYRHAEKPVIAATAKSSFAIEQEPAPTPHQSSTDESKPVSDTLNEYTPGDDAIAMPTQRPVAYPMPLDPKRQIPPTSQTTKSTSTPTPTAYPDGRLKRSYTLATPSPSAPRISEEFSEDDEVSYENITDTDGNKITRTEVSIARSISISRQNRRMIRPVVTTGRSASVRGRKPSQAIKPTIITVSAAADVKEEADEGAAGKLAETKASTPNVVNPLEVPSTVAQHRRSEQVVLEEA